MMETKQKIKQFGKIKLADIFHIGQYESALSKKTNLIQFVSNLTATSAPKMTLHDRKSEDMDIDIA